MEASGVCFVDDELDILESFSSAVGRSFPLRTFNSAQAALRAFDEGYDSRVIVTDLSMPEMNGLKFIESLNQRLAQKNRAPKQVFILSGQAEKVDVLQAIDLGVSGFMEKPFSLRHLKERIQNSLGREVERKQVQAHQGDLLMLNDKLALLNEIYFSRVAMAEDELLRHAKNLYRDLGHSKRLIQFMAEERKLQREIASLRMKLK